MNTITKSCLIAAFAASVMSCGSNTGKTPNPAEAQIEQNVPEVKIAVAKRQTVPQEEDYSSTIQANIVNNIAPQTAGRIQALNVEVGDFVSEGQILARMDKVSLAQAELKLKNAEDELNRVKQLLLEGGISQSDFDQMHLSYNVAKSTYDNLLENTILKSPISGVVTARNYDNYDLYAMSKPVYTIEQITPVKLLVGVSESDYTKVKRGDKVSLTVDAIPGKTFKGSVIRLYPTMDAATHTFNVEVKIPNEDRVLRPGMYARVTIKFGENNSVVVPDQSIVKLQGSGQRSVYVLKEDGTVELRVVELGRHFGEQFEILKGLEEGEKVVVGGQTALKSGIKVEVI